MFKAVQPLSNPSMGGSWQENSLSFGLVAENVVSISYLFYPYFLPQQKATQDLLAKVKLDAKFQTGDVWGWQADLPAGLLTSMSYLIQLEKADGSTQFVIDPFARESLGGEFWGQPLGFEVSVDALQLRVVSRLKKQYFQGLRRLPVLRRQDSPTEEATLRPSAPNHRMEDSIVYECHVRGMTSSPSSTVSNSAHSGTFQGLVDCIPYLKKLGVTTLELLPVFDFDENENSFFAAENESPLLNYWGYSPLQFFAPKQNYAADWEDPVQEFKELVDKLHQAGLEIWLDVVFNHTAEFGQNGPQDHFKSLAPSQLYLQDKDGSFSNYSGCGNTLKCAHPTTRRLIRDSLIYWSHEMGVDGFRFDLAAILNRDASGNSLDFPQLLWELRNDPALKNIKLISEPWDAAGAYELGKAAAYADWTEWNDRYRDTIRRAVRGEDDMMGALKDSLLGSPSIFGSTKKGRRGSLNFITSHDGMTLMDLVSYNNKHNENNAEENKDGHHDDFSVNCGIEGKTDNQEILDLRFRKLRMFHCLLQLSNGIPMLVAGDEFGRTQHGNNNAYCHDSVISWLDWTLTKTNSQLLNFTQHMIALRKQYASFLFAENSKYRWFNAAGGAEELAPYVRTLHFEVRNSAWPDLVMRILINCFEQPVQFVLPKETAWKVLIDTDKKPAEYLPPVAGIAWLSGFSVQVLRGTLI